MPNVFKRKGSPHYYARFQYKGRDYCISTATANRTEALAKMRLLVRRRKGELAADDLVDMLVEQLNELERRAADPKDRMSLLAKRQDILRRLGYTQRDKLLLADAWETWLSSPKKRNPGQRTIEGYKSQWERFSNYSEKPKDFGWIQKNYPEVRYLHEVSPGLAEDYARNLWESGCTPQTYNKHLTLLAAVFNVLKTRAGLLENPWAELPRMSSEREGRRQFSSKELKKICRKAMGNLRYLIAIGLYGGLRLGDAINLSWAEVDLKQGFITYKPLKTRRTGKTVKVPLHPVLQALLTELKEQSPKKQKYLFPAEHQEYQKDRSAMSKRVQLFLKEDCKIATSEKATSGHRRRSITRVGYHSLRHSFVSLCAANRVPQVAIMDLVGHGSPAMTELYSHASLDQKQQAIAALPGFSFSDGRGEGMGVKTGKSKKTRRQDRGFSNEQ